MTRFCLFTCFLLFVSCHFFQSEEVLDAPKGIIGQAKKMMDQLVPTEKLDTAQHIEQYNILKAKIKVEQTKALKNKQTSQQAKDYLFDILTDSIFRYWDGTTWDFNGVTKTPRKGDIACGYFVTTTLQDAGIKLQRYKLAQQAAADIAKKLCAVNSIKWFNDVESLSQHIESKGDRQLYILGLDYHVGFIVRENGENFFVHSNYVEREGVIRENLENSPVIGASKAYLVGNLLENEALLKTWLSGLW